VTAVRRSTSDSRSQPAAAHILPRLGALEALLRKCDGWVEQYVEHFDLFSWSTTAERYRRRKAFAEAALYLYVAHRFGDDDRSLPRLKSLVVDRVNAPRYCELVARHPREFDLYSLGPLYVSVTGTLDARVAATIARVLDGRAVWAVPRRPSHLLGLWHFCTAYGYRAIPIDLRSALRCTSLDRPPGPVEWTLEDAYALTHVVMFHANFGVPHRGFPRRALPYELGDLLDGLILRFMAERDLDIVLELTAAGVLLRQMRPSVAALALDWANSVAAPHGYVPHREGASVAGGGPRTWSDNYHTTLIAGSLLRSLLYDWPHMALRLRSNPLDDASLAPDEALALGQALACLANYELGRGAGLLQDLLGTAVQRNFARLYFSAVDFVRAQRTGEGDFGFRTDDPYRRNASSDEADRCRSLLAAVPTLS
jgi:hypothetical protein